MSTEDNSKKKWHKDFDKVRGIISDLGAFIIALAVIIPFIYFTAITISPKSTDAFKDIAAIWGIWVGSVIGYFFGSRQVEILTKRVNDLLNQLEITHEDYEKDLERCEKDANELVDDYNGAVEDLQYIAIKYQQHLDKELLERLKKDYKIMI